MKRSGEGYALLLKREECKKEGHVLPKELKKRCTERKYQLRLGYSKASNKAEKLQVHEDEEIKLE